MKKLSLQEWKAMRRKNPPPPVDWREVWRKHGPKIIDAQKKAREGINRIFEKYLRPIFVELQPGTELGDLCIIGGPQSTDTQRWDALQRFLQQHKPIQPKRWMGIGYRIQKELKEAGDAHKRTLEQELMHRALSGLWIITRVLDEIPVGDAVRYKTHIVRHVKTEMNKIITMDILGPKWKRDTKHVGLEELPSDEPPPDAVFAENPELILAKIFALPTLTPYEKSILQLRLKGKTHTEIAKELGRTPGGVRTAFARLTEKIQKTFPEFSM